MAAAKTRLGTISEQLFKLAALRLGWEVAEPALPEKYDFVLRRTPRERWLTVQVKSAQERTGAARNLGAQRVEIRRGAGRNGATKSQNARRETYKDGDFDYLAVVGAGGMWLVPWSFVSGYKAHVSVSKLEPYRVKVGVVDGAGYSERGTT